MPLFGLENLIDTHGNADLAVTSLTTGSLEGI